MMQGDGRQFWMLKTKEMEKQKKTKQNKKKKKTQTIGVNLIIYETNLKDSKTKHEIEI